MTTLIELIEQASSDLSTFKNPDVGECQRRLDEIIQATGFGGIAHDRLMSLDIYLDTLHIETSWSTRGCSNSSSYTIPMSIIRDDDPIQAAKIWTMEKRIAETEHGLNAARLSVKQYEECLAKHKADLVQLTIKTRRPIPWLFN
jgi:hypothetical protein